MTRAPLLVIAASLGLAGPARASPDDLVARPLVLAPGAFEARLTAEYRIFYHRTRGLVSLAPDAWLGLSPRWTVGVIHSSASVDRIATGASFCLSSDDTACDHVYRGGGLDVRYLARDGALAVAPRLRALIRDLDPWKPALTVGALVRWTRGRFAITSDPYLRIPLANAALGNRTAVSLPLWLAVQPARGWQLALHTGFDADLAVLADGWHGPLALAGTVRLTATLEATLEAGWEQLLGPQYDAKTATIQLSLGWRATGS
jgi:hypothetical protein